MNILKWLFSTKKKDKKIKKIKYDEGKYKRIRENILLAEVQNGLDIYCPYHEDKVLQSECIYLTRTPRYGFLVHSPVPVRKYK